MQGLKRIQEGLVRRYTWIASGETLLPFPQAHPLSTEKPFRDNLDRYAAFIGHTIPLLARAKGEEHVAKSASGR